MATKLIQDIFEDDRLASPKAGTYLRRFRLRTKQLAKQALFSSRRSFGTLVKNTKIGYDAPYKLHSEREIAELLDRFRHH